VKLAATLISMLSAPLSGGSGRALVRLGLVFLAAVFVFSAGFQALMSTVEGRDFTWVAAIYWTLVTMTTLGFGDIVFESDLGRMYSVLVLLTGALLILILLPFTFIQLVYLPWRAAVRAARTPRVLPEDVTGHLVLTGRSPMEEQLRRRAVAVGMPYVLLCEDQEEAAALHDEGYDVLVGALDDPATYRAARADRAALVLTADNDQSNTNVAFTVREVSEHCVLAATASSKDSIDVLELAGVDHVLHLGDLLGQAFAERILAPTARSSIIARFDNLVIAEATTAGTELVGRTLGQLDLRGSCGVAVVAVWERGSLLRAVPDARIDEASVLLLAGTEAQVEAYNARFAGDGPSAAPRPGDQHVVVLGGGRVGRAVARALQAAGTPCRLVERSAERVEAFPEAVVGDAADLDVLRRAGIEKATAVVVTTHDDDTNIYLTLYCRRLRPEAEILGRVAVDRNVTTIHRAGADFVLSYASVGALEAWNALREHPTRLLAEGLVAFRTAVPPALTRRSPDAAGLLDTGCVPVGIVQDGHCTTDINLDRPLPADAELVLIGEPQAEERFYARFVTGTDRPTLGARLRALLGRSRR
jgi:voltage-gated potassium channel